VRRARVQAKGDVADTAAKDLGDAINLLHKRSPDDIETYRQFVTSLTHAAVNAHREGGALGIGGQQISDDEKALDEIADALKTQPA
jgi:hypothetical protein